MEYATFLGGLTGSSSSEKVRSMTSEVLLLPVLGAVDASRDDNGGVRTMDKGVCVASLLMALTR